MRKAVLYIWAAMLLLLPGSLLSVSDAQAIASYPYTLPTVSPSQLSQTPEDMAPGITTVAPAEPSSTPAPKDSPTPAPTVTPEPTPEPTPETPPVPDKWVALTFDDGPHPVFTRRLLEILERYDAHCTFFVLGQNVDLYPSVVKDVVDAGHSIANHSYSHIHPKKATQQQLIDEIERTNQAVFNASGVWPTLFRPPYGAIPRTTKTLDGMRVIHWSVDSLDWSLRDAEMTLAHSLPKIADGSIVLMHDIHEPTLETVERLLEILSADGYGFVTVEALAEMYP